MSKYAKTAALCLAALAPSLAGGTSSFSLSLACAAVVFVSGFGALSAVRCVSGFDPSFIPPFAAVMISAALSLGGELIIRAAFPAVFGSAQSAPTFALCGAPVFFGICFAVPARGEPLPKCILFTALSSVLVVAMGAVRWLLYFVPMSDSVAMGLIFGGIVIALIRLSISGREEKAWEV